MNDSTDQLIQMALKGADPFDIDPNLAGGTTELSDPAEGARAQIQALLSSLTPELRNAIESTFGIGGEAVVADHEELIDRALSQLRLEPVAEQAVTEQATETSEQPQVQAA